jgi:hypothetical protein
VSDIWFLFWFRFKSRAGTASFGGGRRHTKKRASEEEAKD